MAIPMESAKAFVASSFGYEFENNDLLIEALDTTGMRKRESNQRLALMGDKILAFLVTDTWYPTGAPKGILFAIRCGMSCEQRITNQRRGWSEPDK
jgi:dsRNA-specific ribonuclease